MEVGGYSRTHGHVITKFSCIYRLPFFSFARARASLILILYCEKWLIINSVILLNSCTVVAEMHILSWRFSSRAVNSQWARGSKMSYNRQGTNSPEVESFSFFSRLFQNLFHYTRALYNHFSYLLEKIRFRGSCAKWNLKKLVNLPISKQIAFEGKRVNFCEPSRKDCTHHTSGDVSQQLLLPQLRCHFFL